MTVSASSEGNLPTLLNQSLLEIFFLKKKDRRTYYRDSRNFRRPNQQFKRKVAVMNLNTDSLFVYFKIQTKLKSQAKHLKKKKQGENVQNNPVVFSATFLVKS